MSRDEQETGVSEHERLVESLLPAALGRERVPDLATPVRARAVKSQWVRRWQAYGLVAMLMLATGVGGFLVGRAGREPGRFGEGQGGSGMASVGSGGTVGAVGGAVAGAGPKADGAPQAGGGAATTGYPRTEMQFGISVLAGDKDTRGAVFGSEEEAGRMIVGGYAVISLAPWSTVRWSGGEYAEKFEVLEGSLRVRFREPGDGLSDTVPERWGKVEFKTPQLEGVAERGDHVLMTLVGRFFDRDPEATVMFVEAGEIPTSGAWGSKTFKDRAAQWVMAEGHVPTALARARAYPPAQPLPRGEFTTEGPMSYSRTGWTIRDGTGTGYVVAPRDEELVDGATPRFRKDWIYRVTWRDGQLVSAEVVREPARWYRR